MNATPAVKGAPQSVIVVGGGIGGLAAALALTRQGIAVQLLEQAAHIGEIGAGIQLGPNAFAALDALGVGATARQRAVFTDHIIMMDAVDAREVVRIDTGAAFRERFGGPYAVIHRADIHLSILEAVQQNPLIRFRTSTQIASVAQDGRRVEVTDTEGNRYQADAVIGADGVKSVIREHLIGDPPRVTGHVVYRAVVERDNMPEELRINAPVLWAGPHCHLAVSYTHLQDGHADFLQSRTGLVLDAYFSGTKLAWLLDHVPGARQKAERGELAFGTIDTWLIWQLTGGAVHSTDPSNASRTMLFDLHTQDWNDEILALLNIPRSVLPSIAPSSAVVGESLPEWLGGSIPIAGVAGDQQAATFGQACFAPGMAKNTYGTGCFMLMNVGDKPVQSHNHLLSTVGWGLPAAGQDRWRPAYMLEGGVFVAGAAVQWLRDGLGIIQRSEEIESLAASVADTDDVFMVPAFAGLGAPHWDP